jgi:endoglucanase
MKPSRRGPAGILLAAATLAVAGCVDAPGIAGPDDRAGSGPLDGIRFYVDPAGNARRQAELWRTSRPADAAALDRIAAGSQADWFGDWSGDVRAVVGARAGAIAVAGAVPVFVAYNIPFRDCGGYSGGGGASADSYRTWIRDFAAGIGGRRALVVLEPDALAGLDCLDGNGRTHRLDLLRDAVAVLKQGGATAVYVDAGHPYWHSAEEVAARLLRAGIEIADGFALNVSNFFTTAENVAYGDRVSALLGGARYVIDTGRNGQGATADREWCNARGRGLGATPRTDTGHARVDAFLWIKPPGESDGPCNGGPAAGAWWPEYALELALGA